MLIARLIQIFMEELPTIQTYLLEDVQKYLLATSDFAKGMQDDNNLYVTRDRLSNASFRQKPDPILKNIFGRQNPLELVFQDISTFDTENPVVGSLLREFDIGKKEIESNLVKKAPKPGLTNDIRKRLNALRGNNFLITTIAIIFHRHHHHHQHLIILSLHRNHHHHYHHQL